MNATAWQTLGAIFGILVGIASVTLLAKSSARESARAREAAVAKAVDDAVRPRDERITELQRLTERQADRIDQLEDELRRGRGHGDNDRARQPL